MNRREFIKLSLAGVAACAFYRLNAYAADATINKDVIVKVSKTDEEWKAMLTPEQYHVLREEGTERPFSSPLNEEKRAGAFACAGCGLELFTSKTKYNSGTGWPSFYQAIEGHIETKTDSTLGMERTEYHCAKCGGHQGHVFNDGPQPTGLRYCNNGVALKFVPSDKA